MAENKTLRTLLTEWVALLYEVQPAVVREPETAVSFRARRNAQAARQLVIYLYGSCSSLKLAQVGQAFNVSPSLVSKIVSRMSAAREADPELDEYLDQIEESLTSLNRWLKASSGSELKALLARGDDREKS